MLNLTPSGGSWRVALASIGLVGCGLITELAWAREPGLFITAGSTEGIVTAPDTVSAGVPFEVQVKTFGSGTCTRLDDSIVRMQDTVVQIEVYNRVQTSGTCTTDLYPFVHAVMVRIDRKGTVVLRARGRTFAGDPGDPRSVVFVEKIVQVK